MPKVKKKLTVRQRCFVQEYLIDLIATQAAIRAGYAKSTAEKKASLWVGESRDKCPENMRHVWDAVQEAKQKRNEEAGVDASYVLNRLVEIDKMDVIDLMHDDGSLKPVSEWPKVWRQYISGFELADMFEGQGEDRMLIGILKKVKFPDKVKNLELLGKHVTVNAWKETIALVGGNEPVRITYEGV